MIVVTLMGGLGNQMFQYAFAKSLSLDLNHRLLLDGSFLSRQLPGVTPRAYELSVFDLEDKLGVYHPPFGLGRLFPYRINKLVEPLAAKLRSEVVINDQNAATAFRTSGARTILLEGWFQSESYFKKHEAEIRKTFVFRREPGTENTNLLRRIANDRESVSLHVRRGDYLNNPATFQYHGVCSPEYYRGAIASIKRKISNPRFYIFSDDIEWCKMEFTDLDTAAYVSHNSGSQSFQDMRLMSTCRHHIIANSSFSWWGAWLNPSSSKLVVAPAKWFNSPSADTGRIVPKEWITL